MTGWRVQHNLNRGPSTGGVRYTPDLTLAVVRANAMRNTWKAALVEIPYGGAFGGVVANPKAMSAPRGRRPHPPVHDRDQLDHRSGPGHPDAGREHR